MYITYLYVKFIIPNHHHWFYKFSISLYLYLASWVIRAAHISKNSMVWWPVMRLSRISTISGFSMVELTSRPWLSSSTRDLKSSK